jgi:hypothetical protein
MHTTKPFLKQPSASEAEAAIVKLKRYTSPGADQIPAELIQAGRETLRSELIKLIWNTEESPHQWKESNVVPIHKKGEKLTIVITKAHHYSQFHTKFHQTYLSLG